MKLTIFGATGRTGRQLLTQALEAGHEVTAFVRDPSKLGVTHSRLRVMQGDVYDASVVEDATKGQDAVLSALGPVRGGPKDVMGAKPQTSPVISY